MSYTLRQVKPLLTQPELELFQASRAGAIGEFTPKRLTSKIQRARALRDKYRDVYKRQTVQTRKGAPEARKAMGGENTRTQTKSEILDDVLKRFEAQHAKLHDADGAPAAHHEPSDTTLPNGKFASAPTDIPALAQRMDLLKAEPINKSMHGAERSRTRAAQGKRDAR